jgi:hypothetical protein
MKEKRSFAPVAPVAIAIVLLLPLLYVGSYLALVVPGGFTNNSNYRWGGMVADYFFWPLEQIDRSVRPKAWLGELFYRPTVSPSPTKQNTPSGGLLNDSRSREIEKNLGGDF